MFESLDLWQIVVIVSLLAGLASALVNGITDQEIWHRAASGGCTGVAGRLIQSVLLIVRSMVIGLFAGVTVAALAAGVFEDQGGVAIPLAAIAAFLADPVLKVIKRDAGRIVSNYLKGMSKDDDRGPGGSAQAG